MDKILVIYIGITGIRSEDISDYVHRVTEKIMPITFKGEVIVIPVQSIDTRVECIDPKYISEYDLIIEHTKLMEELDKNLKNQIEQLKMNKNE